MHGVHRVLHRVLSTAIEWNYVPSNPAKGIKLPPCRRREPPFVRPEQFQELLLALSEPVRTMVHMTMMTSMRIGEILALRWGRVDLERGVIRIEESYYRGHFSSVKSRPSQRQVPLSFSLLHSLRERYQKASPELDDLVFAARNGSPLGNGNLLRRFIYPTCDRLKIPRVSWHALRHLHGTLLSQLGVPVAVAQAQLGHSNPRITLAIYTHVLPGAQRDAVDRLERYLFPSVPKFAQGLCNRGPAQQRLTQ